MRTHLSEWRGGGAWQGHKLHPQNRKMLCLIRSDLTGKTTATLIWVYNLGLTLIPPSYRFKGQSHLVMHRLKQCWIQIPVMWLEISPRWLLHLVVNYIYMTLTHIKSIITINQTLFEIVHLSFWRLLRYPQLKENTKSWNTSLQIL